MSERSGEYFFPIAVAVALSVLASVTFYRFEPGNIYFTNDAALSFAVGDLCTNGECPLIGPPSHQGGRHLGPWYYWLTAFALAVTNGSALKASLVFSAIKLLGLMCIVVAARWSVPAKFRNSSMLGAALCILSGGYQTILRTPWHVHFLLLPTALSIFCALACFRFGRAYFLWFTLALAIMIETHFAGVGFAIGLFLPVTWFLFFRRESEGNNSMKSNFLCIILPTGLLIGSLIPTILYEWRYPSNLLTLIKLHLGSPSTSLRPLMILSGAGNFINEFTFHGLSSLPGVRALAYCSQILALCIWWKSATREQHWILITLLCGFGGMLLLLLRVPNTIPPYLFYFALGILPVVAGIAASTAWLSGSLLARAVGGTFIICLLVSAVSTTYSNIRSYSTDSLHGDQSMLHAMEVANIIESDSSDLPVLISVHGERKQKQNAYHYFLSPLQYPLMYQIDSLLELPTMTQKLGEIDQKYSVLCWSGSKMPRSKPRSDNRWSFKSIIELSSCHTCTLCRMSLFDRTE